MNFFCFNTLNNRMKIKQIVLTLLLCSVCVASFAQRKPVRRVYMWDVTLSMQGRAGCPNIWNTVKEKLINEINLISDPAVEIVLIPFQHRALHEHMQVVDATNDGKQKLVKFIQDYKIPLMWVGTAANGKEVAPGEKGKTTMTAHYAPLDFCINNVITPDRQNYLEFMTDGVSDFPEDAANFNRMVDEFCNIATEKELYLLYVMLNEQAKVNIKQDTICSRIVFIPNSEDLVISFVDLQVPEEILFNTHDDYQKDMSIKFLTSSSSVLKSGYKVHVKADENPFFDVDQICEVSTSDNSITFTPKFKMKPDDMRNVILHEGLESISLRISPTADMKDKFEYNFICLYDNSEVKVKLITIAEKKVSISWE